MTGSSITAILYEPPLEAWPGHPANCSIGLVIAHHDIAWSSHAAPAAASLPAGWGAQAREVIEQALLGLSLDAGTRLEQLDARLEAENRQLLGVLPGLIACLEEAVLTAPGLGRWPATVPLAPESPAERPQLILEVANDVATADIVQTMIALRPDGLGYRLASGDMVEAIGRRGEHLQRFVRELGMLLIGRDYSAAEPPIIYLGLNGALGELTVDPRRELGHVLGHATGLEKAAGTLPLWLEDPLLFDDAMLHAATLNQLRDYMRVRSMRSQVVGRAHATSLDDLHMLVDTDAVDGVCLERWSWPSLSALIDAARIAQAGGKQVVLRAERRATGDQVAFLLSLGEAIGAAAVLVSVEDSSAAIAREAVAIVRRRLVWESYRKEPGTS